jgi:hypothetical protein
MRDYHRKDPRGGERYTLLPEVPKDMIRVFYGDDRIKISEEIIGILGAEYEVFEGAGLVLSDLPTIFRGMSLLAGERRRILIKDLSENKAVFEKVADYLDTDFDVVLWETKLDKRSATYKALARAKIEIKEFKAAEPADRRLVFEVFDMALRGDAHGAVDIIERMEKEKAAAEFFGLLVYQGIKRYENGGAQAEKILRELAKTDIEMKNTDFSDPWISVKSLLVRLSSL